MTIALRAAGTATLAAATATTLAPAVPAGTVAGDLSVLSVECKPYTTTITTPTGWTKIGEATNGTVANAADVGSTKIAMYVRENAPVGAIPAITMATAGTACAVIHSYSKDAADNWDYSVFTSGGDSTNAANYSATGSAIATTAADWIIAATAVNSDLGTVSAQAIGGLSGDTLSQSVRTAGVTGTGTGLVTTGNGSRLIVVDAAITAGSSSAAPTFTYTNASSTSGTTMWLRLREAVPTSGILGSETWPGSGAIPAQWTVVNAATTSQASGRGSLAPSAATGYLSGAIYMSGATARADWEVSTDIVPVAGNVEHYPGIAMAQTPATAGTSSSSPDRGYSAVLEPSGNLIEIFKSTTGTQTSIGSFAYTFTSATKVSLVFRKQGNTLSVWAWDTVSGSRAGTPNWTATDTSFTTTALKPMLVNSNGAAATVRTVTFGAVNYTNVPIESDVQMDGVGTVGITALVTTPVSKLTFPPMATVDTLSTDIPTITQAAQATTTISGGTLVAPSDSRIHYRGAGGFAAGVGFPLTTVWAPNSRYDYSYATPQGFSVTFQHTGTTFETMHYLASTSGSYRLKVDGKRVSDLPVVVSGLSAGGRHVRKFVFGSSATRIITLETAYHHFGGVFVNTATDTIAAAPAFNARIIFQGDSITGGSGQTTGLINGTYPLRLADYIGIDDPWNAGVGSTGYVDPGTSVKLIDRISDVTSWSPDVVVVFAGFNDTGEAAGVVQDAATTYLSALHTALPSAEIYAIGCWVTLATPTSAMILVDNEVKAAAAATDTPFISPLTGDVYNSAGVLLGNTGEWVATSGDVAAYIGADTFHPNDAGNVRIAQMMRNGLYVANGGTLTTETTSAVPMAGAGTLSLTGLQQELPSVPMAGAGALSITPLVTHSSTVPMAGAGTLAIVSARSVLTTVPMTGAGALAVSPLVAVTTAVSLAGAGTFTLAPVRTATAALPMGGAGNLAISPSQAVLSSVSLSGSGALTLAGQTAGTASVPMTSSGALSLTPALTHFASVTMAGAGGMSVTVIGAQTASVTMAGTSTLAVSPVVSITAVVSMTGAGALSVTAATGIQATLTLTGTGALSLAGTKTINSTVALAGTGGLSISPVLTRVSSLTLAGSGVLTFTTGGSVTSAVPMDSAGTLSVSPVLLRVGALSLAGAGTLALAGSQVITGSITMNGAGVLTVTTAGGSTATVAMSGAGALSLAGIKVISASFALAGAGALTITGGTSGTISLVLAGTSTLTLSVTHSIVVTLSLSGTGTFSTTALVTRISVLSLTGSGALTVAGTVTGPSLTALTFTGTGTLALTGQNTKTATLLLQSFSAMFLAPSVRVETLVLCAGISTLAISGITVRNSQVQLNGSGALTLAPIFQRTAVILMTGFGTLTVIPLEFEEPTGRPGRIRLISMFRDRRFTSSMYRRPLTIGAPRTQRTVTGPR